METDLEENLLDELLPTEEDLRLLPASASVHHESARRHAMQELQALREEEDILRTDLEAIQKARARVLGRAAAIAHDDMVVQRAKRKRVEEDNHELRHALYLQSHFIKQLHTVFSSDVVNSADLNLVQIVHKYTHLRRDAASRRTDYGAMFSPAQLAMTSTILCRETACVVPSKRQPFVSTQFLQTPAGPGWTVTCVFAFDTLDVAKVLRAACVTGWENERWWPQCKPTSYSREIVNIGHTEAHAPRNQYYCISKVKLASIRQQQREHGDNHLDQRELQMEMRPVVCYILQQDQAQLMVDFVDDDDLHPFTKNADFCRKSVGSCTIGREWCEDGELRAVCRVICTKLFAHGAGAASVDVGRRYFSFAKTAARDCGMVMHDRMVKHMAVEDALVDKAQSVLQA